MKESKKMFKSRIFIFVITAVLFSVIGVSAATYFESNAVIYDNTESGLSSTNVQEAIDELYNTCSNAPTMDGGSLDGVPVVDCGDGLYEDEYEKGRYVYRGTDPNNYIKIGNATYRIISLETNGMLKITSSSTISTDWDFSSNDWETSDAMSKLNDFTLQNGMIEGTFNIGAVSNNVSLGEIINQEKSKKWTGNVGSITLSDYLMANLKQSVCGNSRPASLCSYSNWIFIQFRMNNFPIFTMTASANSTSNVWGFSPDRGLGGGAGTYPVRNATMSMPRVVFLEAGLNLSGTGTSSDPYIIS